VHRDIKTGNILLDANLEPHISDFGIAKNIQMTKTHTSTYVMGTIGYIDPEYARTSMLTEKSDVYSYGIVLLELLTDRPAVNDEGNLLSWVMLRVNNNTFLSAVAPDIKSSCSNTKSIEKVLNLALKCTDKSPNGRPTMYDVVQMLLTLFPGSAPTRTNSIPKLANSTRTEYMDTFVNSMYYKDSLGSDSLTDVRLLEKFGEVIS
jgi:serine/threonine protein kinase